MTKVCTSVFYLDNLVKKEQNQPTIQQHKRRVGSLYDQGVKSMKASQSNLSKNMSMIYKRTQPKDSSITELNNNSV